MSPSLSTPSPVRPRPGPSPPFSIPRSLLSFISIFSSLLLPVFLFFNCFVVFLSSFYLCSCSSSSSFSFLLFLSHFNLHFTHPFIHFSPFSLFLIRHPPSLTPPLSPPPSGIRTSRGDRGRFHGRSCQTGRLGPPPAPPSWRPPPPRRRPRSRPPSETPPRKHELRRVRLRASSSPLRALRTTRHYAASATYTCGQLPASCYHHAASTSSSTCERLPAACHHTGTGRKRACGCICGE